MSPILRIDPRDPHPPDCPVWEYEGLPRKGEILKAAVAKVLIALRSGSFDPAECAADTRRAHRMMFTELTPPHFEYYAGNYRGTPYRCLKHYRVGIPSDPRVGAPPGEVLRLMREWRETVRVALANLDATHQLPDAQLSRGHKLAFTVTAACRVFELLLRVHPYANGNGHAARVCIWSLLGRYGYWPLRWRVEPRPPDPPYTELIARYRSGDRDPLEEYVLQMIASN